ncbi:MAG: hypothetical protein HY006_04095 [Candidatus Sungbacteria bacterium]|nr:hypothetical protein [Candidatus Sungbacteria bacterium]
MNEDKLTTEEERLLAELASAQYFGALEHLKNMLTGQGVSKLLTNTLPNDELRYWQGFVAGIATFIKFIEDTRSKIQKEGFGD